MGTTRWRSSRAEKIRWLMANQHLWGSREEMATGMKKAGLFSKETSLRDVVQGLDRLMESVRDCGAGDDEVDRFEFKRTRLAGRETPPTETR